MKRQAKVRKSTIALVLLAIAVFLIAGTYARYSAVGQATANTSIANWSVAITSNDLDLTTATQNIKFIVNNNADVVANKVAPGVTATATVNLDLTGTEVAVDFDAVIDTENYNAASVGASFDKLQLTTTLDGTVLNSGVSQLIPLENNSAFTAANGVKTITLTLTWVNDDTNNADDTAMGIADKDIVIPITFTAKQHIVSDAVVGSTSDVADVLSAIASTNEGGTVTLTDSLDFTQYERTDNGATPGQMLNFPNNSTLDLGGQTITTRNMGVSYQGNDLTIQNGNLEAEIALASGAQSFEKTGKGSYALFLWDNNNVSHGVTVKNITTVGGINLKNAQDVVIENCNVTATNFYAVYANGNSSLTIKSGTYRASQYSAALFGSVNSNEVGSFKIYGGTFISGKNTADKDIPMFLTSGHIPAVIYGGTFDKDVSSYVASGYECVPDTENPGMYIVRLAD